MSVVLASQVAHSGAVALGIGVERAGLQCKECMRHMMALGAQRHCLLPPSIIGQPECEVSSMQHACAIGWPHHPPHATQLVSHGPAPKCCVCAEFQQQWDYSASSKDFLCDILPHCDVTVVLCSAWHLLL